MKERERESIRSEREEDRRSAGGTVPYYGMGIDPEDVWFVLICK